MTNGAAAARGDDHAASSRRGPSSAGGLRAGTDYDKAFTRLCHLVPLSDGKGDEAVDGVVIAALALAAAPVRGLRGVVEAVDVFFGVTLDDSRVELSLDRLVVATAVRRSKGQISLRAEAAAAALERIEFGRALEEGVRAEWLASPECAATGLDGGLLWRCLTNYMASVFRSHGILAAELLDPEIESSEVDAQSAELALAEVLAAVGDQAAPATRVAIETFFTRPSSERARYVAQMLDATFTLFAMTLDETVAGLLLAELEPIDLFLDTNVVFGLLDLDTDARGQAAKEVVRFIRENRLPVTLYYHEETYAEIERTVSGIGSGLRSRSSWPPELSRAALDRRVLGELRGVERRYHELNAETPTSPSDFLSKYQHVQELLADWGVKLFRSSGINRYTTEHKGAIVAEYLEYVKKVRPGEAKSYESADHDVTVWLEVQQRGRPAPNSLKTGALFLTNDNVFRRFLAARQSRRAPQVVLPPQLLQVLRPFGSRSVSDDERFVSTLCLPEFRTAHTGYGDTQRKVMGFLAQYSDVRAETAVRILADEVLMRRVRNLDVESEDFKEVLESQVLRDNGELARQREAAEAELAQVRAELEAARQAAELAERERDDAVAGGLEAAGDLEEQLAAALRRVSEVQELAQATVAMRVQRLTNLDATSQRRARGAAHVISAPFAAGAAGAAAAGVAQLGAFEAGPIVAVGGGFAACAAAVAAWRGMQEARRSLQDWLRPRLYRRYLRRIGDEP